MSDSRNKIAGLYDLEETIGMSISHSSLVVVSIDKMHNTGLGENLYSCQLTCLPRILVIFS